MKRLLIVLALLSLFPLTGSAASEDAPSGAPRLEVKTEVDLGDVRRGQPVTAVFELHNAGTAVLEVLNAKPG